MKLTTDEIQKLNEAGIVDKNGNPTSKSAAGQMNTVEWWVNRATEWYGATFAESSSISSPTNSIEVAGVQYGTSGQIQTLPGTYPWDNPFTNEIPAWNTDQETTFANKPPSMSITLQRLYGKRDENRMIPLWGEGDRGVTGKQLLSGIHQLLMLRDWDQNNGIPVKVFAAVLAEIPKIRLALQVTHEAGKTGQYRYTWYGVQSLTGTDWRFEVDNRFGNNLKYPA